MSSRNSASPSKSLSSFPAGSCTGLPAHRRLAAGLWASAFVAMSVVSALAQGLGAAVDSKICQAGPINDTIEYLLWLLQQL